MSFRGRWRPLVDYVESGNPIMTDTERDAALSRWNAPRGRQAMTSEGHAFWRRQNQPVKPASPRQKELGPFARKMASINGPHLEAFRRWRKQ